MITKPDDNFLIKMHGHIASFTYSLLKRYSLKRVYHMRPDFYNLYSDLCNLNGQISLVFSILYGVSYISFSNYPYKYVVIKPMRCISKNFNAARLIKKLYVLHPLPVNAFPQNQIPVSEKKPWLVLLIHSRNYILRRYDYRSKDIQKGSWIRIIIFMIDLLKHRK